MNSLSKNFIFAVAWDNVDLYPETEKPYVYDLRNGKRIFEFGSSNDGEIDGHSKALQLAENLNNWWINQSDLKT